MQFIYSTDNAAEAHMISHMLEENGIMAQVTGEFLQSGMGEIASHNCIKVSVIDEEFDRARDLFKNWEGLCKTKPKKSRTNKIPKVVLYIYIAVIIKLLLLLMIPALSGILKFVTPIETITIGEKI